MKKWGINDNPRYQDDPCLPRAAFWSVSLPFRAMWMRKKRSQKYDPSYQEAQNCLFSITLLLQLSQQSQQMAVGTIPENPCGKTRTACSEFDVYHPDLGQGQLKDLNRIQSIDPRAADGQKLEECGTNMKLKDQREEGKEGTTLCSRFQHKPIHIYRQKAPIWNPPNKQMLTKWNDSQINLQKTTFIFQRNVSRMDMSSERDNPHRRKNWWSLEICVSWKDD